MNDYDHFLFIVRLHIQLNVLFLVNHKTQWAL